MKYQLLQGDNRNSLKTIADNSIDSIVTDPPYGIDFLGKAWDANTGALETYQECLRVLKPGGHILAFSAARTYHHLAVTLEQAGFEIRDQLMWIYSSGFPKSQDVGRSIQRQLGVKETTKLKSNGPANGFARLTFNQTEPAKFNETKDAETVVVTDPQAQQWEGWGTALKPAHEPICMARKPLGKNSIINNVQQWGVGALNINDTKIPSDQPIVINKLGKMSPFSQQSGTYKSKDYVKTVNNEGRYPSNVLGEITDYQKYFYCPKVSKRDRLGFNTHPTVKPVALMEYLIKLVTPQGGVVLDPFNGSGSTAIAALGLNHSYVGCELDPNYIRITEQRIQSMNSLDNNFEELFTVQNS